jgi:hypothetical protein
MVTEKLRTRLMLIGMLVIIRMEGLQTLIRLFPNQSVLSPIMEETLLQLIIIKVSVSYNIILHTNQILWMVRVDPLSGTMEMVRQKIRLMLTGM